MGTDILLTLRILKNLWRDVVCISFLLPDVFLASLQENRIENGINRNTDVIIVQHDAVGSWDSGDNADDDNWEEMCCAKEQRRHEHQLQAAHIFVNLQEIKKA